MQGRNPVFALEMIQTFHGFSGRCIMIQFSRNPVFALEMIQTVLRLAHPAYQETSQSSIRPGDDSDGG